MTITSGTCGTNATYRLENDGTLYIEGTGKTADTTILNNSTHYNAVKRVVVAEGITGLGTQNFLRYTNLKSVELSSTVTLIGSEDRPDDSYGAFYGCTGLTSINLSGVINIGNGAFRECSELGSVDLRSAETIGENAFWSCYKLAPMNMSKIKTIGDNAFQYCREGFTSADLSSAQSLGGWAFDGCYALKSLKLGNVKTWGRAVFSECTSLTAIDFGTTQTLGEYAFNHCENLKEVVLPSTLSSIGSSAFSACYSLTSIDLGNVVSIGTSAFSNCTNLMSVVFPPTVNSISAWAFEGCPNLIWCEFLGNKPSTLDKNAFGSSESRLNYVTCITNGWGNSNVIGNNTWMYTDSDHGQAGTNIIWKIYKDGTLEFIGTGDMKNYNTTSSSADHYEKIPFRNFRCKKVVFDDRITRIGDYTFYNISGSGGFVAKLRHIRFPKSLKTIGTYAFYNCYCKSLIFPPSLKSINSYAFSINTGSFGEDFVVVFRGTKPSLGTNALFSSDVQSSRYVHYFSAKHSENDTSNSVNTTYPIMMKIPDGWKVLDHSHIVDNT